MVVGHMAKVNLYLLGMLGMLGYKFKYVGVSQYSIRLWEQDFGAACSACQGLRTHAADLSKHVIDPRDVATCRERDDAVLAYSFKELFKYSICVTAELSEISLQFAFRVRAIYDIYL